VPDLAAMLMRRCLGSLTSAGASCSECERTPLAGERLHEMDSGRTLCDLCLVALPEDARTTVRSERVGASERRLAVAPKVA
jgi:hypothetical protein